LPYINGKYISYDEHQELLKNPTKLQSLNTQEEQKPATISESGGFGLFSPTVKTFSGGYFEDYKPGFFGMDEYLPAETNKYSNFQELRAANQSAGTQLAFGASKFLTTTGTTILDGTLGTIVGLASMMDADPETGFINNPFSNKMNAWNKAMEEVAPNYYTKYQQDNIDITSANFWGDTVLKNAGFAVGSILPAMLTGGATMSALTRLGKKTIFNQLKQLGKVSDDVVESIARGETTIEQVIASAGKQASATKAFKTISEATGSAFASLAESRMEAIDARESTKQRLQSTGEWDQMTEEQRTKALDAVGNTVFGTNMALLSASNFVQFRNLFSRGFDFNKQGLNIVGNFKDGFKKSGKDGLVYAGKILKSPLTESLEEGGQYMLSEAASEWAVKRANDPDSQNFFHQLLETTLNTLSQAANGNNKEFAESVLSGAILGLVGIPFVKGGNIASRIKEGKSEIAERNSLMDKLNNNPIAKKYTELGSQVEQLKALLTTKPEDLTDERSKEIASLKEGVLTSLSLMADMQKSLLNNDKSSYKSFEDQEFANSVFTAIESGKIEELADLFKSSLNISPEELRQLQTKEVTTKTANEEKTEVLDPNKYKQTEDLVKEHKERINEKLDNLNKIANIYSSVQTNGNGKLSSTASRNLTIAMYNASQLDNRQKELNESIKEAFSFSELEGDPDIIKGLETQFGKYETGVAAAKEFSIQDLIGDLQSPDKAKRNKAG
jgi:hypothetical protein